MKKQIVVEQTFAGVDLLKIDVEGFESHVVSGMSACIEKYKPLAVVEILDEEKIPEILELFGEDYRVFVIDEANGSLKSSGGDANKLFIPAAKLEMLAEYAPGFG